ncbi:unnamed protein product [Ixodes hexagonus]
MVVAYVPLIFILSGVAIHAETTDANVTSTVVPVSSNVNIYTNASHENSSTSAKASGTTLKTPSSSTVPLDRSQEPEVTSSTTSVNISQQSQVTSTTVTVPVNISEQSQVTSTVTVPVSVSQQSQLTSTETVSVNVTEEPSVASDANVSVSTPQESPVTLPTTAPVNTSTEAQVTSNATEMDILNNTRTTTDSRTTAKVSNVTNITEPEETSAQANVTTSFQSTEFVTKESGHFTTDALATRDMSTSTERQGSRRYSKSAIIATVVSVVVFLIGLVGMGLWFYNVRYRLHRRDQPILRDTDANEAENLPFSVVYYQNDGNEGVTLHNR